MKIFRNIKKVDYDPREYLTATLLNGIKILYIYDETIDKSTVCIKVNVGSYNDPDEYLGLAHFLEHMIFMGSKKYKEGELLEYTSNNGGMSNAQTSLFNTIYYSNILSEYFEKTFDILADYLVNPSFSPSSLKEVNSVHAEYVKNINTTSNDILAFNNITKSAKNKSSRFSIGNLKTLNKKDILSQLKKFHEKYYVPEAMSIVIIHNKPYGDLSKFIVDCFPKTLSSSKPIIKSGFVQKIKTQQSAEVKSNIYTTSIYINISYSFVLELKYYGISFLQIINSKHKGGLIWTLYSNLLASLVYAYVDEEKSLFVLKLIIGPKTSKQCILAIIRDYFEFLKNSNPPKYIYDESLLLSEAKWNENVQHFNIDDIVDVAEILNVAPDKDILFYNFKMHKWDEKKVNQLWNDIMKSLTLDNAIIIYGTKKYDKTFNIPIEHYDQSEYKIIPNINYLENNPVNTKFCFKKKNIFIKGLKQKKTDISKIQNDPFAKNIFTDLKGDVYVQSAKSHTNKVAIVLHKNKKFNDEHHEISIKIVNNIIKKIITCDLNEDLNDVFFSAKLDITENIILISLESYENYIIKIFKKFMSILKKINLKKIKKFFDAEKKALTFAKSKLNNMKFFLSMDCLIYSECSNVKKYIHSSKTIKISNCENVINNMFLNVSKISVFSYGNYTIKNAIKLYDVAKQHIPVNNQNYIDEIKYVLPNPKPVFFKDSFSSTSSVKLVYIVNTGNIYDDVLYSIIFAQILDPDFFYKLRTVEQLGYTAYVANEEYGISGNKLLVGVVFFIKSNVKSARFLRSKIITFANNFDIDRYESNYDSIYESVYSYINSANPSNYKKNLLLVAKNQDLQLWTKINERLMTTSFSKIKKVFKETFLNNPDIRCVGVN